MKSFALFTDFSLNPQLKLGLGGYLLVPTEYLKILHQTSSGVQSPHGYDSGGLQRLHRQSLKYRRYCGHSKISERNSIVQIGECADLYGFPVRCRAFGKKSRPEGQRFYCQAQGDRLKNFAMACAKYPLAVVYYLPIISWSIDVENPAAVDENLRAWHCAEETDGRAQRTKIA
jgi:hypothetical protein